MIIKGSRYSQTTETRNGETTNIAVATMYNNTKTMTLIAEEGQTLQYLAFVYLNNASLYWKIADLNPNILFPDKIPSGTIIKIPIV
jgi:hypothetical protein